MKQIDPTEATAELRSAIKGALLLPTDDGFMEARQIWNGAVRHQPLMIVLCETAGDVQAAVTWARKFQVPVSVRGGGHDWAGRALADKGLVIDLTRMRKVRIHADEKIAVAEGGITAGDLIKAADPYDLVAVTGTAGVVGWAGLALGGGYGPLNSLYGMALDNLLKAEMVLADGRLVTVSETDHSDLFWAIRGGGGGFGVVTSMTIRLHAVPLVLSGMILYKWEDAQPVYEKLKEAVRGLPDELYVMSGLTTGQDGSPLLFVSPTWIGDPVAGEQAVAVFKELGNPVTVNVKPMRYKDILGMFDARVVNGDHVYFQTRIVPELTTEILKKMVQAGNNITSSLSSFLWHHSHGHSARIPLASTAFGYREEHLMMVLTAGWTAKDSADAERHKQWVRDLSAALVPDALPGGYVNLIDPEEITQIGQAYGPHLDRLKELKKKYDPDRFFSAIPFS